MCNLSRISVKSYLRHLESKKHENMKYSFHAKGAAILHFLRAESKLASQRRMLKSQRRGIKGPVMRCRKCQCDVFGYIREHAKTVEHIALRNYLRVDCCNNTYFNRADLEEHRLTLVHLKNKLELEQKQKEEEEEETEDAGVSENEEGKLFAKAIAQLKKSPAAVVTDAETLMPYNPSIPRGLNFIQVKAHYRCEVCPQARLHTAEETVEHFKSLEHYNNLKNHLNKLEEEKELEKKRLEEEAEKAEIEKKKQEEEARKREEESEAKKKNGEQDEGEEISFEDMHNMETVDEASDDGDMETGGKVNHGAAEDEEIQSGEDFEEDDEEGEGEEDDYEEGEGEEEEEDEDEEDNEVEQEQPESCGEDENEASVLLKDHSKEKIESEAEEEDCRMKEEPSKKTEETETVKSEAGKKAVGKVQEPVVKDDDMPSEDKTKIEVTSPQGRRGRGRGRGRAAKK
ncbi:hypothetical protein OTU49_011551 [Cherax quadricarinatus]